MKNIFVILPHQLFEESIVLKNSFDEIYILEEFLFFKALRFHKQKLNFHRQTMQAYRKYLTDNGLSSNYIKTNDAESDLRVFLKALPSQVNIHIYDPHDNWLEKRLNEHINITTYASPSFISSKAFIDSYFDSKKIPYKHHDFYIKQRKELGILIDIAQQPTGGQWSFDKENRKKYPKNKQAPKIETFSNDEKTKWDNKGIGYQTQRRLYPIDFKEAKKWLECFLIERFNEFGIYEDAIVSKEHFLNHSVLSPMLNCGLLTPTYVITRAIDFASKNDTPLASLEGFIRQIIGWREFINGLYQHKGTFSRNKNFWKHECKMPESCYDASTGIPPVDDAIEKLLKTGYNHHIERLMILGNFFLLTEIKPNAVYKWFMEMYIDAYDWVMVPNVYGMSQFADGGLFATKPYISGSNYIIKMSDYKKGEWSAIWDALFWRFMIKHENFFNNNYRMKMLITQFHKRDPFIKNELFETAEKFLDQFHNK